MSEGRWGYSGAMTVMVYACSGGKREGGGRIQGREKHAE